MSFQVTTAHRVTFTNNMQLALQQMGSKLAQHALQQNPTGRLFEVTNLIGSVRPNRVTVRHGDTQFNDTPHSRRWMPKTPEYTYAELVDTADRLVTGIDLQGAYTQAAAQLISRARDDAFLQGFYGVNQTGETGTTQTSFASANIVPVNFGAAGATGMNLAKLREAKRILRANLVDVQREECYIALTSEQIYDLTALIEATSMDFNPSDRPVMREDRLTRLMGFNIIECEIGNPASFSDETVALTVDGSGYRRIPFWCKSGMAFGTWHTHTQITPRPDKNYSMQVFAGITCAATRTEEGKCGQILCAE